MSEQKERFSREEVVSMMEGAIGGSIPPDAKLGGSQIENFREGWARYIAGSGAAAHYFRRTAFDKAVALCGYEADQPRWLYGPGNFDKCRLCGRKAQRLHGRGK